MSKSKKQHYVLSSNYDYMNQIGSVEIIKNPRTGLTDNILSRMVIAPTVEKLQDGTVRIVSWSLVPSKFIRNKEHKL